MAEAANPLDLPVDQFISQYAPGYNSLVDQWLATNPTIGGVEGGQNTNIPGVRYYATNQSGNRFERGKPVDVTNAYLANPEAYDFGHGLAYSTLSPDSASYFKDYKVWGNADPGINVATGYGNFKEFANTHGGQDTLKNLDVYKKYNEAMGQDWLDIAGNALIQLAGNFVLPGLGTAVSALSQEKPIDPLTVAISAITGKQGSISPAGGGLTGLGALTNISQLDQKKDNLRDEVTSKLGAPSSGISKISAPGTYNALDQGIQSILSGTSNVSQVGSAYGSSSGQTPGIRKKKKGEENAGL